MKVCMQTMLLGLTQRMLEKSRKQKSSNTKGLLANMLLVKSNACKHVKLKHGKFQGKKLFRPVLRC